MASDQLESHPGFEAAGDILIQLGKGLKAVKLPRVMPITQLDKIEQLLLYVASFKYLLVANGTRTMKADLGEVKGDLEKVKGDLAQVKGDITTVKSTMGGLSRKITTMWVYPRSILTKCLS